MQVHEGLDGLRHLPAGTILSVGNFDGVHRGHLHLLATARQLTAAAGNAPAAEAGVTVVTFEPHPLTVLRPEQAPPRLTSAAMKQQLLGWRGVDHLVLLPPTPQVLDLSAEAFWHILRDQARPAAMVEGQSFYFGKNRGGTIERLRRWTADSPVRLHVVPPVVVPLLDLWTAPVSSSLIRWLLSRGRVRDAAICLGRPYVLEGEVIHGFGRGRGIGFPTANLQCADQLIPGEGVYAGRCRIDGVLYPAAVSIGSLPTFRQRAFQVEAYILDFDADLYGRTLQVELIDWLRDQRPFGGIKPLQQQLHLDVARTRALADLDPAVPIAAG